MQRFQKNPYSLFFSLGTIGLFMGLSVWVIYGFLSADFYLGRMHAHYMVGIFLLSFVIGFLMTAIPRMSGAPGTSKKELIVQLIPMLSATFWGAFETQEKLFFGSIVVALIVLFIFCFRRIATSPNVVPDVFPFVIISLLSGLVGAILFILDFPEIGGRLFYMNMILGLCVGVGARLIPMILGTGCTKPYGVKEMWLIGLLLVGSSFIEIYVNESYGNLLRFLLILVVFFRYWTVQRSSGFHSSVSWGVRIAAVSILFGTMGLWLVPQYRLEALHLLFISGFGLLTLMVASRVILAHGNHNLSLEIKNLFIKIPIGLIILASATRISAVFVNGYQRHLGYAALVFLVAVLVWSFFFIPKLIAKKS